MKAEYDRLEKRYGSFGRYNDVIDKILAKNKMDVMDKTLTLSREDWSKALGELTKQKGGGVGIEFVLPDKSGIMPTKKAVEASVSDTAKIMSKNLRQTLRKKMMEGLQEWVDQKKTPYLTERGKLRGKMHPDLISMFENKVKSVFRGYTKKDPAVGMPPNIHVISVTEMRIAVNTSKRAYADKLKTQNPSLDLYKRWIHNNSLVYEPRPGHEKLNQKEIPYSSQFKVDTYKKVKGYWVKMGSIGMAHPHDISAPISEVAGCQCDFEVYARKK